MSVSLPAPSSLPAPGAIVGGKYRVEGLIGRGGMGVVLAATHRVTGRRVALKWLLRDEQHDAELTQRLVREAQAAGRVRHENVVDVYDVGEHEGAMFLVMELLEGETLAERLRRESRLDVGSTLQLLMPVMRGVQAAHACGVIHRDLKPSNIFLSVEPGSAEVKPRVLDFGVSKIGKGVGDDHSLTQSGTLMGTPYYMAPEQLADGRLDARADVYALGVILYQCLSGALPYDARSFSALVTQVATREPTPLGQQCPELPASLQACVMRALARDPQARHASVTALIEALEAATREPSASTQAPAASPGTRTGWLLGGLIVILLLGYAVWRLSVPDATAVAPSAPVTPATETPTLAPPSPAPEAQVAPAAAEPIAVEPAHGEVAPSEPPTAAAPRAARRATRARSNPADSAPTSPRPIKVSPDQF